MKPAPKREEYMIGHQWAERRGLSPAIVSATEVRGKYPGNMNRVESAYWILDYEYTPHGKGKMGRRGATWRPRPAGTVHLYPPHLVLREDTRGVTGVRHSAWVFLTGGRPAGLERWTDTKWRYARFMDEEGLFGELFHQVARIGQEMGEAGFWAAQEHLCRMIRHLLEAEHVADETWRLASNRTSARPSSLVEQVDQYVGSRLGTSISLSDIASHLHVSVSQLSHRYRERTGVSPMAAVTRRRIEHAKLLLMKGVPLKTISQQLGFSDAFHLSKAFKKALGMAPRQFLKSNPTGEGQPARG